MAVPPEQKMLIFYTGPKISTSHAARLLECSNDTVLRLIEQGELAAERFRGNGWWRVYYDSVIERLNKTQAGQMIGTKRAARILECSEDTVLRLIEEKMIQADRYGHRGWWRVSYASVVEYLNGIRPAIER